MISQQISRDLKMSFLCAGASWLYILFSSLQILIFQGVDGIVLFHFPHCVHHGGEYDQKHAQYGDAAGRPRQMEGGFIGRCDCAVDEISMTVNMSRERTTAAASAPKPSRTALRTLCLCFFCMFGDLRRVDRLRKTVLRSHFAYAPAFSYRPGISIVRCSFALRLS